MFAVLIFDGQVVLTSRLPYHFPQLLDKCSAFHILPSRQYHLASMAHHPWLVLIRRVCCSVAPV